MGYELIVISKKMSKIKTYSLLNVKFFYLSFVVFVLFFSIILCSIGSFKILTNFRINIKTSITGILFFVLYLFLIFFFGRIIYIYIKYVLNEWRKNVKVDFKNETLTIFKNSNYHVIDSKNIERIEFYLSTSNYKSLMRYFEYVKFITNDNKEYVVTSLILDYSIFENMFKNVKKTKMLSDIIFLS